MCLRPSADLRAMTGVAPLVQVVRVARDLRAVELRPPSLTDGDELTSEMFLSSQTPW